MGKLEGKVAIVTGAARGQGEAEARLFVEAGRGSSSLTSSTTSPTRLPLTSAMVRSHVIST